LLSRRSDREPAVTVADRLIDAEFESEHVRVEAQRAFLIVDEHAGQMDADGHRGVSF
jgi:hypothetical protein